ncbi:right-handed parallel beta-helix repeat-containing protein [Streptomyces sp. NPDC093085]|uniref:right-handed parallel beta-helix repeat-containing protein n=1 Tax=Streptomyces sp. NPDC093085 TaxID=3155068 RepID=UPI0034478729
MALYTYGGTPTDILTTASGEPLPDHPVTLRLPGGGAIVTGVFEADGTTPIGELRGDGPDSPEPGVLRRFLVRDVPAIEYEYTYEAPEAAPAGADAERAVEAVDAVEAADAPAPRVVRRYRAARAARAARATTQDAAPPVPAPPAPPLPVPSPPATLLPLPVATSVDLSGMRVFNPMLFGAVGDGVADDTAAIQSALDAAYAAGGGTVFFPPGRTYNVATFMVCRANTTVVAHGATIRSVHATTGCFRNFYGDDSFPAYGGHSHIRVYGGTWDGNARRAADGSGVVTGTTNIMTFIHCSDILVKDATFRDCSGAHGVEVNAVSGARIVDCRFEGFADNTADRSRLTSEAVQIDIARSGSSSIGDFDSTACRDIQVTGCWFGPSARLGDWGRAVGTHAGAVGSYYDRITVRDCEITGAYESGILAMHWRSSVISGNRISGTGGAGIRAASATSVPQDYRALTITDNIIEAPGADAGIRVAGLPAALWNDVVIRGNTVRAGGGYGVRTDYAPGAVIEGNRVSGTAGGGILAQRGDRTTVTGNSVTSAGSNGINIAGCSGAVVSGNLIDATTANHGIMVGVAGASGGNTTVSGNTIRAAASAGIRLTSPGVLVTANRVRKDGGTTLSGVSSAATATGCAIIGNDLAGNGWTAATALPVAGEPALDWSGATTAPGQNLI